MKTLAQLVLLLAHYRFKKPALEPLSIQMCDTTVEFDHLCKPFMGQLFASDLFIDVFYVLVGKLFISFHINISNYFPHLLGQCHSRQ